MTYLIAALVLLAILWAISVFGFRGSDLSAYDQPSDPSALESFPGHEGPSEGHWEAVTTIEQFGLQAIGLPRKERLAFMRRYMDEMGSTRAYPSTFHSVDAGGVPAEWVLAPEADPDRRVLFIHGGAFMAGSHVSHRNITSRFSEVTGASVLAIDYRCPPEHPFPAALDDVITIWGGLLAQHPSRAMA